MIPLIVFLGAGAGGVARYVVGGLVQEAIGPAFPAGTLVVNVSGSLLLAFGYALLEGMAAPPQWRLLVGVGFFGGYTTFSTFSYETVRLLQNGEWQNATFYITTSVFLSILAAVVGFRLAALVLSKG